MAHNPFPPEIIGGAVYHKAKSASYASACNNEAIRVASASPLDFEGIDLDLNLSKDLTAWGVHWPAPTRWDDWYDPAGFWTDRTLIKNRTDKEVKVLRVDYRGKARHIQTAAQLAKTCVIAKPRKLIPCFEVKRCRPFTDPNWWNEHFLPTMPKGATPIIMSLPQYHGMGLDCLAAAHEVGLPTMWLWRGGPPPPGYKAHVDLMKSQPGRKIYAV